MTTVLKTEDDVQSTIKVVALMLLAPVWWLLLTLAAFFVGGPWWAAVMAVGSPPLALLTRWYFERRSAALHDARTFFVFWSRGRLRSRLLDEGQLLAGEISRVAQELRPRVA